MSVWHVYRVQTWFKLLEYGTEWASALTSVRTQFICQVQSSERVNSRTDKHWLCLSHDSRNLLTNHVADDKHVGLYVRFEHKFQCRCYRQCRGDACDCSLICTAREPLECAGWLHYLKFSTIIQMKILRGPIMLFYKVLILFWGCTRHALMLGGSKIALFFHII